MPSVDVYLTRTPEEEAARQLSRAILSADREHGSARVAIAGGSAVRAFRAAREALPVDVWARAKLTWVDERCVPFESADSNRGEAHRAGALDDATPPALELPLVLDGETAAQSLARVEAVLREAFGGRLDVTLLGMGPDGHIASLFPRDVPFADVPHDVLALHVTDSPKPPAARLTLTRALLATAKRHVLLAAGESKREALERLILEDPSLPAVGLDGLVIVTDVDLGGAST